MYRAFYSLSSMPLLLILSALSGSLGRVTGWELIWAWLLHREETWTSKRGQKEKLLGERRQTTYQGLIKPWRVICTVRPLRIGIKTEEVSGRAKGKGGWGMGGRGSDGSVRGVGSLRERVKGISFRLDELHCRQDRNFFVSLISFSPSFSKQRDRTRENCWDKI